MKVEYKIESLGLKLPENSKSMANYVPAVKTGNYVFTSGNGPMVKGEWKAKGKLGRELTLEEGYECAKIAVLNCLAAAKSLIEDLDRIKQIIRVVGFINSAPGFEEQTKVLNGASDLLVEIFGEKGKHARLSIGASELPFNVPVEIELIIEVY